MAKQTKEKRKYEINPLRLKLNLSSAAELARKLGISHWQLQDLVEGGQISPPKEKFGNRSYYKEAEVQAILSQFGIEK